MSELELAGRWLLVLLALGWMALPLTRRLMPGLPDGGIALARPLAVLLLGSIAWLASSLHLLPFATAIWFAALPALALLGALAALQGTRPRPPAAAAPVAAAEPVAAAHGAAYWRFLAAHEILFVLVFAGFAWLRGYSPDITFTEKPMELMFLNSVLRTDYMPPIDGWLAGHGVNYYYLGYVLAGALTYVANVPVGYAFNLMLTTVVALTAATAFGLGASLWALHAAEARPRLDRAAAAVGLLAAYLVVAAGNLVAGWRWLRDPGGTLAQTWWTGIGWASSRVVVDRIGGGERPTINEFPWFSFLLGDLHPHVLALPVGLLALGLALDWWRASPLVGLTRREWPAVARLLLGALVIGSLYALNSWDFPLYLLLAGLALARPAWAGPDEGRIGWRPTTAVLLSLAAASVLLFLPFYLSFSSFAGGGRLAAGAAQVPLLGGLARLVGIVTWGRTGLDEFLQVYGFLAPAGAAWLLVLAHRGLTVAPNLVGLGIIGLALTGTLLGSAPAAVAGALIVAALLIWRFGRTSAAEQFTGALLVVGLALPVAAEFFFLQDVFGDRMNTVFKSYYQAWLLLSLVAALGVGATVRAAWRALRDPQPGRRRWPAPAGGLLLLTLLLLTAGYPLIATPHRTESFKVRRGLDGLAYLRNLPDEQAALAWVADLPPGTVVAEDPGKSYGDYFGMPHARAATIGRSLAPLGWPGHEQQWRGGQPAALAEVNTRYGDLHRLYSTTDAALAQTILDRYGIEYVYVGAWERDDEARARADQPVYSAAALNKFGGFMDIAFEQGRVTIYRRRD